MYSDLGCRVIWYIQVYNWVKFKLHRKSYKKNFYAAQFILEAFKLFLI